MYAEVPLAFKGVGCRINNNNNNINISLGNFSGYSLAESGFQKKWMYFLYMYIYKPTRIFRIQLWLYLWRSIGSTNDDDWWCQEIEADGNISRLSEMLKQVKRQL